MKNIYIYIMCMCVCICIQIKRSIMKVLLPALNDEPQSTLLRKKYSTI